MLGDLNRYAWRPLLQPFKQGVIRGEPFSRLETERYTGRYQRLVPRVSFRT